MNPPSARQLREAIDARDELYTGNVTDPKRWEQVATLLDIVGLVTSAIEARRKARNLRKMQEREHVEQDR